MPDNAIAAKLRENYRIWSDTKGGNSDIWIDLFAPEMEMNSVARGAQGMNFSASRKSAEEARGYFKELTEGWEMIYFEVDDIVADGDRAAAILRVAWRNKGTGKICETPKVDYWRFKDGRAISFMEYFDTAGAFRAAGA